jgi:hypothetical protein
MLIIGVILPGIDNAAHVGGLAAGFGVAYLAGLPHLDGSPQEQGWRIASYVCIALTALSFFNMYQWFTRGGLQL